MTPICILSHILGLGIKVLTRLKKNIFFLNAFKHLHPSKKYAIISLRLDECERFFCLTSKRAKVDRNLTWLNPLHPCVICDLMFVAAS